MRELVMGENTLLCPDGKTLLCEYRILIRTLPPPVCTESYGIRLILPETGEEEAIPDITVSSERIGEIAEQLLRCGVTPCTLRDVIEDQL